MKGQNEGTALIWAQMRNWLFKFLFVYSLSYFPLFYNIKNTMLIGFHTIENLSGDKQNRWDQEYPDMNSYPGKTAAYITDTFQLVLNEFTLFRILLEVDTSITNLIRATEYGNLHNKSVEMVKTLCRSGRIPGAKKIGRDWMIPSDAPYPTDKRYAFKKK